jgi:Tol biopolymer transport system component
VFTPKKAEDRKSSIWVRDLNDNSEQRVTETQFYRIGLTSCSSDEQGIAFHAQTSESYCIGYLNLETGKNLVKPDCYSPQFIQGHKIIFCTGVSRPGFCYHQLGLWDPESDSLNFLSSDEEICNRLLAVSRESGTIAAVRSDAYTQMNEYIDILDLFGKAKITRLVSLTGLIRFLNFPQFSPDGKFLLWNMEHRLFVTELKNKQSVMVADQTMPDYFGWSPDGQQIFFTSQRGSGYDIYVSDPKGKRTQRITSSREIETHLFWMD